jgi:sialate O-acetylesterase
MHVDSRIARWLSAIIVLGCFSNNVATIVAVTPNPLFQDHMVLQRDMPVRVWGTADPGESVTVAFAGQTRSADPDAAGKWQVTLDPLKANATPAEMTIRGKNKIVIKDVLVGEVWLASGQSNMTFRFQPSFYPDEAAHANPLVRTANIEAAASMSPQDTVRLNWNICTPQTIGERFSAVGYFFANRLSKELHIPVAIIHSSWEGTRAEPWINRDALLANPALRRQAQQQIDDMIRRPADDKAFFPKMIAWEKKYGAGDDAAKGFDEGWGKPDFDASTWKTVTIPTDFRAAGLPGGGVVWFRKELDVPASAAGKSFELNPGYTVDMVQAFWNGVRLKSSYEHLPYYPHGQGFQVPGELVKAGRNVVSIRIHGHAEGHLWCVTKEMRLPISADDQKSNEWRYKVETRFPDPTAESQAALPKAPSAELQVTPGCLFNAMIRPLTPFAIRGAIWYQGESNVQNSHEYREVLTTLIQDWRAQWHEGPFPFYIVQLANVGRPPQSPEESDWAEVREAQLQVSRQVPNTGLAVTIDIGEENDIHPRNKRDVGYRLALNALAKTYGRDLESSGPQFESMEITGRSIRLRFSHLAGGLVAKNGPLRQFAIAGSDKKFVWAEAKIEGDSVLVSSADVSHPIAVRYAWAKNPAGANLNNQSGLPASPFRTDSW